MNCVSLFLGLQIYKDSSYAIDKMMAVFRNIISSHGMISFRTKHFFLKNSAHFVNKYFYMSLVGFSGVMQVESNVLYSRFRYTI